MMEGVEAAAFYRPKAGCFHRSPTRERGELRVAAGLGGVAGGWTLLALRAFAKWSFLKVVWLRFWS
jgi:hypothetical protein